MVHSDDLVRRKAELRVRLLARRRALGAAEAAAAAEAVAARVAELIPAGQAAAGQATRPWWPPTGRSPASSIRARRCGSSRRAAIAWPCRGCRASALPLAFHAFDWERALDAERLLTVGGFGVMQPDPAALLATPGVVLVPLLGFDRRGHRLGYGQGYYDRTLRALRAAGSMRLAIGIAFALQEVEEVPAGPADEPLDAIVTEQETHRPAQAPRP